MVQKPLRGCVVALLLSFLLGGCSNYLVNRLAFHPVPLAADDYEITDGRIQELTFTTADRLRLHAFYIPYSGKQKLVIFFHGNFGNSLHRLIPAWELAKTGVNVMLVSYRGYGRSEGKPSEAGLYRDGAAAIDYAMEQLGYAPQDIFLLGRSLGSAVAVDVAQDRDLGGLILISSFPSGNAVMETQGAGWLSWFVAGTPFNSMAKVPSVKAPGLFIHGDRDTLIPLALSRELYQAYPSPYKSMTIVAGAGHNDLFRVAGSKLWTRIETFVNAPRQKTASAETL